MHLHPWFCHSPLLCVVLPIGLTNTSVRSSSLHNVCTQRHNSRFIMKNKTRDYWNDLPHSPRDKCMPRNLFQSTQKITSFYLTTYKGRSLKVSKSDRGLLVGYQSDSKIIFLFLKQKIIETFKTKHDFQQMKTVSALVPSGIFFPFVEKKAS